MTTRKELLEREYGASRGATIEQLKTIDLNSTVSIEQLTNGSSPVDIALDETNDLITESFKPWYAKQAYRLGVERYIGLAREARRISSGSPAKVFSSSLKRAS